MSLTPFCGIHILPPAMIWGVLGVRSPNIATAQALALNSSGVVVGTSSTSAGELHAFVASASAGMLDLNDISDAAGKSLVLYYAEGINDNGLIVGYGHSAVDGKNHAFLATPFPLIRCSPMECRST